MKIIILTFGTHGDVRPYVALGQSLKSNGHSVTICASDNFTSFVTDNGLQFKAIGDDFEAMLKSPEVEESMKGGLVWNVPRLLKLFKPKVISSFQRSWQASQNADLIIFHPKTLFATDIAESLGIPAISTGFQPHLPTREFPFCVFKGNFGPFLNKLSYSVLHAYPMIYGGMINDFRTKTLGLKKRSRFASPLADPKRIAATLYAWSPQIVPRAKDWPDNVHVTGYWFLDEPFAKINLELEQFLSSGEPPLYIGFGSMPWGRDEATDKIQKALKLWGGRAIVAKGWGGLSDIEDPNIHTISHAPHNLLLPRVSAVVHHGGAGSTAAGLRAGRPTLVCPIAVDQPFWGNRVYKLGAGPKSNKLKNTTPSDLARTFDDLCTTQSYRIRATEIAERINQEDGVKTACKLIEEVCR